MSARHFDARRRLLGQAAALMVLPLTVSAREPTPPQGRGPFYPVEAPADRDHDLTRVPGREGRAEGEITDLEGRVLDRNGNPLSGLRVEIWQCDANGRYRHPRDPRSADPDPNFQGFGHTFTDAEGHYRFRTIRPVPYPGRTPHIHAAIFGSGKRPFVTQVYVKGERSNAEDFLFQRVDPELRPLLLADFRPSDAPDADWYAAFDFVLAEPLADRRPGVYPFV